MNCGRARTATASSCKVDRVPEAATSCRLNVVVMVGGWTAASAAVCTTISGWGTVGPSVACSMEVTEESTCKHMRKWNTDHSTNIAKYAHLKQPTPNIHLIRNAKTCTTSGTTTLR